MSGVNNWWRGVLCGSNALVEYFQLLQKMVTHVLLGFKKYWQTFQRTLLFFNWFFSMSQCFTSQGTCFELSQPIGKSLYHYSYSSPTISSYHHFHTRKPQWTSQKPPLESPPTSIEIKIKIKSLFFWPCLITLPSRVNRLLTPPRVRYLHYKLHQVLFFLQLHLMSTYPTNFRSWRGVLHMLPQSCPPWLTKLWAGELLVWELDWEKDCTFRRRGWIHVHTQCQNFKKIHSKLTLLEPTWIFNWLFNDYLVF